MKRFLITVAALTLLGAPAAFAQQPDQKDHTHGQNQSGSQGGHSSNNTGQGNHQSGGGNGSGAGSSGGNHGGNSGGAGGGNGGPSGSGGGPGNSGQGRVGAFQGRGGNPPLNAGPGRGPPPNLHQNIPAPHRYRAPVFHWPQGFAYRRFSYGDFLPGIFLSQNYWIYDYADYDLPYPPPGLSWARYGPDALLVDRHTGEVDEVIYDVFY